MQSRLALRCAVVGLVVAFVVTTALVLVYANDVHVTLYLLMARYLLLLPAIIIYVLAGGPEKPSFTPSVGFVRPLLYLCYLVPAIALAGALGDSLGTGDSGVYRFQSRLLSTGRLTAVAPPRTTSDTAVYKEEFHFNHFFIHGDAWSGKYPPGWPVLLALGVLLKIDWLINPLLGVLNLWLAGTIARRIFNEHIEMLTLFVLVASPYFLLHHVGFLSEPICTVFCASAVLFFLRGWTSNRVRFFVICWILIGCAILIRPYTGACFGAGLGAAALWILRRTKPMFLIVSLTGLASAAVAGGLLMFYNWAMSGDCLVSPYTLAGATAPFDVTLPALVKSVLVFNRWSLQDTALYAFPFIFLLAGFTVVTERKRRPEVMLLVIICAALVLGHTLVCSKTAWRYGERYWFPAFFAVAILAAQGWVLITERYNLRGGCIRVLCVAIVSLQLFHYAVLVRGFVKDAWPYAQVQAAIDDLELSNAIVFLQDAADYNPDDNTGFNAPNFNLNEPEWSNARVFIMPDPGVARREIVANALGRAEQVVVSYDASSGSARVDVLTVHDPADTAQ